jgi:hypothetical protein
VCQCAQKSGIIGSQCSFPLLVPVPRYANLVYPVSGCQLDNIKIRDMQIFGDSRYTFGERTTNSSAHSKMYDQNGTYAERQNSCQLCRQDGMPLSRRSRKPAACLPTKSCGVTTKAWHLQNYGLVAAWLCVSTILDGVSCVCEVLVADVNEAHLQS